MNNDLINRSELKKAIYDYIDAHTINWVSEIIEIIDSAPTVDLDERDNDAFETGYIKGVCENRPAGKWFDYVDDSLLKARHGNHVIYKVDFLLDNLAREVSIMESVRQMRDKEF